MNTFRIILFALLLSSAGAFSQYYNQRGYGGMNRDLTGASNAQAASKPSAEETEKYKAAKIEKFMAELKEELKLDELQYIAIKNEVTSNSKNVDIVIKKENANEEKSKEIKALMEQTEIRINSYLNKDQKEKFAVFTANRKEHKKEKKDKKDKKEDKKEDKPIEE